jgi:adenylate cyclase
MVRVGLASGEMVSIFGDLYGPGVNLAARLVTIADPATAVVSKEVQSNTAGFQFELLPPFALKGFPGQTIAYRIRA